LAQQPTRKTDAFLTSGMHNSKHWSISKMVYICQNNGKNRSGLLVSLTQYTFNNNTCE